MMFPPPENHERKFEDDVWTLFWAMGSGYEMSSRRVTEQERLRATPPENSGLQPIYPEDEVVQELTDKGLIEEINNVYQLTQQGQRLYAEFSNLSFSEGQKAFVSRVHPQLRG